jgi:flagellin-like protein
VHITNYFWWGALSKLLRRGIEPIIAVVILVAVTLVIAIGVIGWIMGWWGAFGATESLQFYPDSSIVFDDTQNKWVLNLHLKNAGSASAVIYKIEISGVETLDNTNDFSGKTVRGGTVGAGTEDTLTIQLSRSYTSGTSYLIKIYTRAGNVYSVTVQAK